MTPIEQQKAARRFAETWQGKGYEKGESQPFWISLLSEVLGIEHPTEYIFFEQQVKLDHTAFIDAYIPQTHVMIEQKSVEKDLGAPVKQSDGVFLTPFQQAKRYASELPYSKRPRWIVTCNFREFWVYDMEQPNGEPQKILLENLDKEYYRLQFLVDESNDHLKREMEVSMKAGELVGIIYDKLLEQYIDKDSPETLRSLNIFCVRLVFCLYAEDAGLFATRTAFHDYMQKHSAADFRRALMDLFVVLDTPLSDRDPYLNEDLAAFPYVNGGLFSEENIVVPRFTEELRQLVLQKASADFDWSEISPTIFGAVFESTLNPVTRRSGGMHYTSIENIHKVIDPLFLNDLRHELDTILEEKSEKQRNKKLEEFQDKLASLTFLDPACGSGNFLTEAYLSLRRLENEVIRKRFHGQMMMGEFKNPVKVSIRQFYGIEINDFAVTVAATALWISEAQMLTETERIIQHDIDFLPLKSYSNIREGNALRMDWGTLEKDTVVPYLFTKKLNVFDWEDVPEDVLAHSPSMVSEPEAGYIKVYDELNVVTQKIEKKTLPQGIKSKPVVYDYIMGNPPFVGYSFQSEQQKEDLEVVNGKMGKNVDYVVGWYMKAAQTIQNAPTKCAFVSTNSITQGEQVAEVWKPLFEQYGIQIDFAYRTFVWNSESTQKAHVHCVIVGFSNKDSVQKPKFIFDEKGNKTAAENINPYLLDAPTVFVGNRKEPLCKGTPIMYHGSLGGDDGAFYFSEEEYDFIVKKYPESSKFLREVVNGQTFLHNGKRYCLWCVNQNPVELKKIPEFVQRVEKVKQFRQASKRQATKKWAVYPYLFIENMQPESGQYLIVPLTSSERREYVPIGYLPCTVIANNSVRIVPNATLYDFGVLTSSVFMSWMRAVCGRLKSDYRITVTNVYNNFVWCSPTDEQRKRIEHTAQAILDVRAKYTDSTLADLYDSIFMPAELRKAHQANDQAVMAAYGFAAKMTENEIVAELFKLYREM